MKRAERLYLVVMALLAGGLILIHVFAFLLPGPADRAALRSYVTATGNTDTHVVQSVHWKRCAIVDVKNDASGDGASLAMLKRDRDWVLGRMNSETVWFDSEDVYSERSCLDIATSNGPRTS